MYSRKQNTNPAIQIILAILVASCTVSEDGGIAENAPLPSPGILAETLVANANYIRDCETINPVRSVGQKDYRGLLPGRTTSNQTILALGDPESVDAQFNEWRYDGFSIYFKNQTVDSIFVSEFDRLPQTSKGFVLEFGCPNVIFAEDMGEEPTGSYGLTIFVYYEQGVEVSFRGFPILLSSPPDYIYFFQPESLSEYLDRNKISSSHPESSMPVLWNDAIK